MTVGPEAAAGAFLAAGVVAFGRVRRPVTTEADRAPQLVTQCLLHAPLSPERAVDVMLRRPPLAVGAAGTSPVRGRALPLVADVTGAVAVEELAANSAAKTGSERQDEHLAARLAAVAFGTALAGRGSGECLRIAFAPITRGLYAAACFYF